MARVPFGTTCSPFLLAATIRHHLDQMSVNYPETTKLLRNSVYVDDILMGAECVEDALRLRAEVTEIFSSASMKLHQWASNDPRALSTQPTQPSELPLGQLTGVLKVLGLVWRPDTDVLSFSPGNALEFVQQRTDTKRFMLQTTSRLYDPLGMLTPFTIRMKICFQKLWRKGVDWEEQLPSDTLHEWKSWCNKLPQLCNIELARFYRPGAHGPDDKYALHFFADASKSAYGAVCYISTTGQTNNKSSTIVLCKSRVAPMKETSLARLELLACLVSARMYDYVRRELDEDITSVHFWTDSMIALYWISGDPHKWKDFVRHRVTEIQSKTDITTWRHCPGKQNPADFLTRGVTARDLLTNSVWWTGPNWLISKENGWPPQRILNSTDFPLSATEERTPRITSLEISVSNESPNSGYPYLQLALEITSSHSLGIKIRIEDEVERFITGAPDCRRNTSCRIVLDKKGPKFSLLSGN